VPEIVQAGPGEFTDKVGLVMGESKKIEGVVNIAPAIQEVDFMSWLNTISELAERYRGNAAQGGAKTHEDFQRVAQSAPQDVLSNGIAHMFRSDETPAFPDMISSIFRQSNQTQKAGLLSELLSSLAPEVLGGLPGLGGLAGKPGGAGSDPKVLANQLSPEQVQQIAAHAQVHDPSIIDRVSRFYSEHPEVLKAVGGLALGVAMRHMMRRAA
jgi:hypothetical protein